MSLCNLTSNVYGKLLELIKLDLETASNSNKPFVVKDIIQDIYDLVYSKKQDNAQALGYAQHVPNIINTALIGETELTSKLQEKGLSLDELAKLNSSFSDSINNVIDYINPQFNPEDFFTDDDIEVEESQPVFNATISDKETVSNNIKLDAEPLNFNTTTGRELRDGKIDPDKEYTFTALRGILSSIKDKGLYTAGLAEYDGHTGFRLVAMLPDTLGRNNLLKNDEGIVEPLLVITDIEGNAIMFDNDGKISDTGKPAYLYLRTKESPDFMNQVKALKTASLKHITNEVTRESMVDEYMSEFAFRRSQQKNITTSIEQTLFSKTNDKVQLDITGGKKGYFSASMTPFADIAPRLSQKELLSIEIIKSSQSTGHPYIKLENIDEPVELKAKPLEESSDLLNNIAGVLLYKGDEITPAEKITYIKQFIYINKAPGGTSSNIALKKGIGDSLVLQINGKNIDLNNISRADLVKALYANKTTYPHIIAESLDKHTYTKYSFDKGVFKESNEDYISFISDNFNIKGTPNLNGKIVALNGYFNWQLASEEFDQIIKREEPVEKKKETKKFTDDYNNPNDDYTLFRIKDLVEEKISDEESEAVNKWWASNPLSKVVSLNYMLNIVNSDAWATWNKSGITLYQGSNNTHLYHEAWHAFSQLYLTKEDKETLYNEVSKLPGSFSIATKVIDTDGVKTFQTEKVEFSKATKRQLEEYLAEEFRTFARAGGKSKTANPKIKNIFEKIWDVIKAFFDGITGKDYITQADSIQPIQDIFDKLYVGDINHYSPSIKNAIFTTANAGIINVEKADEDVLTNEESKLIVSSMDGIISTLIDAEGSGAFTEIFKNKSKLVKTYNDALDKLILRKGELIEERDSATDLQIKDNKQYYIDILTKAIKNYGNVLEAIDKDQKVGTVAYHIQNSIYKERIKEAEDNISEIEKFGERRNDVNLEDEMSTMSLYLIHSLTDQKKDNKGKVTTVLNELGFPKLADPKNTKNFMSKNFLGAKDFTTLYTRIARMANIHPTYQQLLNKLGNPGVNATGIKDPGTDMDLWMKFLQDFNKERSKLLQITLEEEKGAEGEVNLWHLKVGRAGTDTNSVMRKWKQDFRTNEIGDYIDTAVDKNGVPQNINIFNYPAIMADFIKPNKDDPKAPWVLKEGIDKVAFLHAIGIYITDNELVREELENHRDTLNYLAIRVGNESKKKDVQTTDPQELFKKELARIKELAALESEVSDKYASLNVKVAGGKNMNEAMLNSTATQKMNGYNKPKSWQDMMSNNDYQHMQNMDKTSNPFTNQSVLVNSMYDPKGLPRTFNGKRVEMKVNSLVGTSVVNLDGTSQGMGSGSMVQQDKFLTDFINVLNGIMPQAQHGGKTSVFSTSVSKITTYANKKDNNLYVDRYLFVADEFGNYDGFDKAYNIIIGYLQAEIERIHMYNDDRSYYDKIDRFQQAGNFSIFKKILTEDTKNKLLSDVFRESLSETKNIKNTFNNPLNKELSITVKKEMRKYFEAMIQRFRDTNHTEYKAGIPADIYKSLNESYETNTGYKTNAIELENAALRAYAFNAWINLVEMDIIHYGETYTYNKQGKENSAMDKDKRIATFFSTGNIFPTDKIAVNFINNEVGTPYRDKLVAEGIISDTFKDKSNKFIYDGSLRTAVIDESNPVSVYQTMFKNMYTADGKKKGYNDKQLADYLWGEGGSETNIKGGVLKPYYNMDEGDGQGWIGWDTYRILKKLEGKWSDSHEDLFNKITKGIKVSAKDITDYFPVYKLQYAGPLKTEKGKLPINAIHKFSLFPMIPNVANNKPLDKLHKKMIEQNIGYTLFRSGSKLATITNNDKRKSDLAFFNNNTEDFNNDIVFTPNVIYVAYLKNQLDLGNKFKENSKLSTQMRKIIDHGLVENGVPIDYKGTKDDWDKLGIVKKDEDKDAGEDRQRKASYYYTLISNFRKRIEKLVDIEKTKLEEETEDMEVFLKKELANQGFTEHEIAFIDFDADGNIIQALDSSFDSERIERILMSIVNNRLINLKLKGESLVEVSVAFTQDVKFTKPTEADLQKYGTSGLPFYHYLEGESYENGNSLQAMKVKVAMRGDFEKLFKAKDLEGNPIGIYDQVSNADTGKLRNTLNFQKSLDKLNDLIKKDEWLNQGNNRKLVTISGVRIPVGAQSAMEYAEVYEFLPPAAGTIIILPTEIVAKSGTDFDVDKLSTYLPFITNEGNWIGDEYESVNAIQKEIDKITKNIEKNIKKVLGTEVIDSKKLISKLKDAIKDQKSEKKELLTRVLSEKEAVYSQIEYNVNRLIEDLEGKNKDKLSTGLRAAIAENAPATHIFNLINDINGSNTKYLTEEGKKLYDITKPLTREFKNLKEAVDANIADIEAFGIVSKNIIPEIKPLESRRRELEDIKRNFKYTVQNSLIQDMKAILSLPAVAIKFLAPNDTHLIRPTADKLESRVQDHNYKKSLIDGTISANYSTTTYYESDFQIKRHQDNVVAGESLGFVAIGLTYNTQHNNAGAYLEETIPLETGEIDPKTRKAKLDPKTGKKVTKDVPVILYLDHHSEDNKILISKLKDKNNQNDIGEILFQALNGFVDAEKDPWVAFIQGNKETIPQLIFLLEAGVPVKDAIYFVSQPAVRDYIKSQKSQTGIFTRFVKKDANPKFAKNTAKAEMINKYLGWNITSKSLPSKSALYYKMIDLHKELYGDNNIDTESLDKGIDTRETFAKDKVESKELKMQQLMLLHYIFIEEISAGYSTLKQVTNVDTTRPASFFDAFLKDASLEDLITSKSVPLDIVNFFKTKSVISAFFQQKYALSKFGKLFPMKNSDIMNTYLRNLLKDYKRLNDAKISLDNTVAKQNFIKRYKNDFMLYIFTNNIKNFQLGKSNKYKGIRLKKDSVFVKYTEGFRDSVYVKKEKEEVVIHVNMKSLQREFRDSLYLASSMHHPSSYVNQKLAPVPNGTFRSGKEYQNFVIEREYLRFLQPIDKTINSGPFLLTYKKFLNTSAAKRKEGENDTLFTSRTKRILYERIIRDKALENTLNYTHLFESGKTTYAQQMMQIIKENPELKSRYKVLSQFTAKGQTSKTGSTVAGNKVFTLSLLNIFNLDESTIDQYHEDLKDLADESKIKIVGDTYEAKINNIILSRFFQKLPLIAFMQGGMNMGENNITRIVPTDSYKYLMQEAREDLGNLTKDKLDQFTELYFKRQVLQGPNKNKPFNYESDAVETGGLEVLDSPFIRNVAQPNIYLLDSEYKKTIGDKLSINSLSDIEDSGLTKLDLLIKNLSSNNHLIMSRQSLLQYSQKIKDKLDTNIENIKADRDKQVKALSPKQSNYEELKSEIIATAWENITNINKIKDSIIARRDQYVTDKNILVPDGNVLGKIPETISDADLVDRKEQLDANLQDISDLLEQGKNLAFVTDGFGQGYNKPGQPQALVSTQPSTSTEEALNKERKEKLKQYEIIPFKDKIDIINQNLGKMGFSGLIDSPRIIFNFNDREPSTSFLYEPIKKEGNNYRIITSRYNVLIDEGMNIVATTNTKTGKTYKYKDDEIGSSTIEIGNIPDNFKLSETISALFNENISYNQNKQNKINAEYNAKIAALGTTQPSTSIKQSTDINTNHEKFFIYLSEQLLTKFSYPNPGSIKKPSIAQILQKITPITQEEVDTNKQKCFGQ